MAATGDLFNIIDHARMHAPDGTVAAIVPLLSKKVGIIDDMLVKEGNLPFGHRMTVETSLPGVSWVGFNEETAATEGSNHQFDETCAIAETVIERDARLVKLGGNEQSIMHEAFDKHTRGITYEVASKLIYGNSATNKKHLDGIATRYSSTSAANGTNVLLGGSASGQTDNAAIIVANWGPGLYCVHPKGLPLGLDFDYWGEQIKETTSGKRRVFTGFFSWHLGLCTEDWRDVVRIPNIDISNLIAESSAADITKLLIKAIYKIPNIGANCRIYMNRTVLAMFDIQRRTDVKAGGGMTYENVDGQRVISFDGIPVKEMDVLTNAETRVT